MTKTKSVKVRVVNAGLNKSGASVNFEPAGFDDKMAMQEVGLKQLAGWGLPSTIADRAIIGYELVITPIRQTKSGKASST